MYTIIHIPIVLGIILTAVGDELLLMHLHEGFAKRALLGIVGGPALFLLGKLLFKTAVYSVPRSHTILL